MHIKDIALVGLLTVIGCVLFVAGIVFTVMWPDIFNSILAKVSYRFVNERIQIKGKKGGKSIGFDVSKCMS